MPFVPNAIAQTGQTFDLSVVNTASARVNVGTCDAVMLLWPPSAAAAIWVTTGDSTVVATIPVSGTPGDAVPLEPGNTIQLVMGAGHTYVAAITGSGSGDLIITPIHGTPY